MKIYISHSSGYDYRNELYAPLKARFGKTHDMFFPHEKNDEGVAAREVISVCDVVLAEVSSSSTGQGIELGWADAAGIPVICMHRSDAAPSGALSFITATILTYDDVDDMLEKLEEVLIPRQ